MAASKRMFQLVPRVLSAPAVQSSALRQCARTPIASITTGRSHVVKPVCSVALQQSRWHSAFPSNKKSKVYQFEDVISILETPANSTLLIDVREPHEFEANTIPTSLNIPVTTQPDALLLSEEDFLDRFGWVKPPLHKEVVFFCKAGVRSSAAAQLAKQAGYENVGEYRGSWLDWERRGGPGTRSPPSPGGMGEPSGGIKEHDIEAISDVDPNLKKTPASQSNKSGEYEM
ncbi:unnamed protein product [Periconia digitata]|uniref:Rhodanese domain-containing protein n=1 Tax=Periconia digitata TaxID=1303443 RepID=A0A9W4UGX8_9PLEO|nr:unnamed protein product [Periconia digitata]